MESGNERKQESAGHRGASRQGADALLVRTFVPIKTISVANSREHWSARQKRVKAEREATYWCLIQDGNPLRHKLVGLPLEIGLIRVSPRRQRMDAHDNLPSALKAVVDSICQWLDRDDADPTITWTYSQLLGKTGVEIVIRPVGP